MAMKKTKVLESLGENPFQWIVEGGLGSGKHHNKPGRRGRGDSVLRSPASDTKKASSQINFTKDQLLKKRRGFYHLLNSENKNTVVGALERFIKELKNYAGESDKNLTDYLKDKEGDVVSWARRKLGLDVDLAFSEKSPERAISQIKLMINRIKSINAKGWSSLVRVKNERR